MGAIVSAAWTLLSGISLKTWLRIGGAIVGLILLYMAYSWAWDRGAASQASDDAAAAKLASEQISGLTANVAALKQGVLDANAKVALLQAQKQADDARAAQAAQASAAATADKRRKEATRGAGADNLNKFFAETFP